jgi:ubiquinone/menaquinone biosynthesis C-methylase UbiE
MSSEEIRQKYEALAHEYRQRSGLMERVFGIKGLRKSLLSRASGSILDVACGTGENFPYLPSASPLTAVDLSPAMLQLARQQARALNRDVDFRLMAAEKLSFEDESFDTVVSTLSTCTFPDPIAALREMQRVCRPDGQILLIEHGRSRFEWLARYQDRRAYERFQEAGCRWNQAPLELVKAAGLKIVFSQPRFLGVFHAIEAQPVTHANGLLVV